MHAAGVTCGGSAQCQRLQQQVHSRRSSSNWLLSTSRTSRTSAHPSEGRHLRPAKQFLAAVETESDTAADVSLQQKAQLPQQQTADPEARDAMNQTLLLQQQLLRKDSKELSGLPQKVLARLGPFRPVAEAAAKVVGAVEPRLRGLILLNVMTFVMGTNWVVVKESNTAFDPVVFTSLRFTIGAAAFAPFLMKGLKTPAVRKAGLEIGVWTALGYLTQSAALALTPASRASLLSTFTVIAVPCLAALSGQKVKPLVYGCGIAALVGTALLEEGGGDPANMGDILSVVSALFFAVQLFRTEHMSRQLPEGNSLNLMAVIVSTVAVASVSAAAVVHWQDAAAAAGSLWHVFTSAMNAIGPAESGADTASPLWELLYTSFCSTDLVLILELMALQDVSSTEAALVYSLEPVSGALMAYAFLGERWGALGWVGAAIILAASVTTQLGGAMEENDNDKGDKGPKEAKATS